MFFHYPNASQDRLRIHTIGRGHHHRWHVQQPTDSPFTIDFNQPHSLAKFWR